MCGIAGIVDPNLAPETRLEAVGRMCEAMRHRGPDDGGVRPCGAATLGMRRLAIFDPANGRQPMSSPDGLITVVFNGAIYNHRQLRLELESRGHSFRTQCDTEVLVAAVHQWGEDCLSRLRGMFAFAAWDSRDESLLLARDPFGIKPLYYRQENGRFQFASEIGALHAGGLAPRQIDPSGVADYLAWFAVPAPRTIFRGIFSLRPGECARLKAGRLSIRSSWSFRSIPATETCADPRSFGEQLRKRLEDTIQAHMLADVPVGAFLSGGLDSAAVVGLMTRAAGGPLRTFSIGFEESGYSEANEAARSAERFGAEHHAKILTGSEAAADLGHFLQSMDQPTGDGLNTYFVSKAAREGGITVALSGLGGDELFGGYPSFRNLPRLAWMLPAWRSIPPSLRERVVQSLERGGTREHKLADILRHARDLHELGALQRRVFSEPARQALMAPDTYESTAAAGTPFHPELASLRADLDGASPLQIASAWELRTYMADVLLRDSDVMSMRHAIELRVPFVDRLLVEWLWRQPENLKFTPARPKSVLARTLADLLPPEIGRRPKRGFTLPLAVWMRAQMRPFLEDTFESRNVSKSGLFNEEAVRGLWRGFLENNDSREWSRVWSLAVLVDFVNRRGVPPNPPPLPRPSAAVAVERPAPVPDRPAAPVRKPEAGPRTLLMAPEIFSLVGGIPRILQTYFRALTEIERERGGGLRLLALNDPSLDSGDLRRCGATDVDDWMVCDHDKVRFSRGALRMSRGCDRIICGHVAQLPAAWAASRIRRGIRYYVVAHGIEVWREFTLAERIALRGASKVLCVSDYTRQELLRNCPLKQGRAVVLPNALDPAFTIERGRPLPECPPTILTVTRLNYSDRYKGVDLMIAAMPGVLREIPEARLLVVGQGDDLPRLQSEARRLGLLGSAVRFAGYVSDEALAAELRSCRLFVLPSRKEGFGLVYLEAMAHGRPCIGARAGGVPEVITEETGMLVEFGDIPALSAACAAALRRSWDQSLIVARATEFDYTHFKSRLANLLAP